MHDPIAMPKQDHREAAAMLKGLAESKPGAARRKATEKSKLDRAELASLGEQVAVRRKTKGRAA
jgi:hypothetical protein